MSLVDEVAVSISAALSPTMDDISKSLTVSLRNFAIAANWPKEIARLLRVEMDGNTLTVTYPPEAKEAVQLLEDGVYADQPNPVIRRFKNRLPQLASHRMHLALAR